MGCEIRRVPPGWEHPRYTEDTTKRPDVIGEYRPLHDKDYGTARAGWLDELQLWLAGKHPSQGDEDFWEYTSPPDRTYYRERKWTPEEATHFQVYETVSEGTPITPAFATKEQLAAHLASHGTDWDDGRGWSERGVRQFIKDGFAMSLVVVNGGPNSGIYEARDGYPSLDEDERRQQEKRA